ncbi:MAG: hypothetical protein L6416_06950, partial [Candidatus Omnitrophica bacterium]|nr:hypothetical protein [Candidatus Omnitrophota bacterium]
MKNVNFNNIIGLKPVGYSELVRRYSLNVLPCYSQAFIVQKGRRKTVIEGYRKTEFYTTKYDPGAGLGNHLTFALKFEGLN